MQNKYFIGYAKESFDGTPLSYGVDLCEEAPEDHVIDVADPGLYVDIQITGRLDDPVALDELNEFLSEHNLTLQNNSTSTPVYASEESINAAFEDTMAATETGLKDKIKNVFTKAELKHSQKTMSGASQHWRQNEKVLLECIVNQKFQKPMLTEVEAARYFVSDNPDPAAHTLYVCYQKGGENGAKDGNIERNYGEVEQQLKPGEEGTKKEQEAIVKVVKFIRNICKTSEIVGYTLDQKTADRWASSLNGFNVNSGGLSLTDPSQEFDQMWKSLKDSSAKLRLLTSFLGNNRSRIGAEVIRTLALERDLKRSWLWEALQYVLKDPTMKFLDVVCSALNKNEALREEIMGRKPRFEGLDFGNTTQFSVIKAALGTVEAAKLHKKGLGWLSVDEMKRIYREKDEFRNAKPAGKTTVRAERSATTPEQAAASLTNLPPEQLATMMKLLSGTKEGQRALANVIATINGGKK